MATIIDFLVNQFYTNQFMTAAVVAAPAAVLTYAVRSVPTSIWEFAKRNLSTDVRFNSDMDNYDRVQEYVLQNVVSRRWSRTFKYHAETKYDYELEKQQFHSSLGVGYGHHFGWWQNRPVWIHRNTEEGNATEKFKESIKLTFLGREVERIEGFIQYMETFVHRSTDEERVALYVNDGSSWDRMASLPLRPIATVLTNQGQGQQALDHLRRFVASKSWYRQRGLPHHTGILFEGTPGTGKSSLIHALASEMQRNLFYLNMGAVTEEKEITGLLADRRRWDNAILVIEDIDTSGAAVNRDDKSANVTLSTLLNVLDGILSPDGLIVIATTNHLEALDPALVRPGRFDLAMRLGPLEWEQFLGMAKLFEVDQQVLDRVQPVYKPTPGATLRALIISQVPDALYNHFTQVAVAPPPVAAPPVVAASTGGAAPKGLIGRLRPRGAAVTAP
jgi:chaperone BCS1